MRFWGKTKYGEKKSSREKLVCGGDSLDGENGDTGQLLGEGASSRDSCVEFYSSSSITNSTLLHTSGQDNMSPPCSPDSTLDRGFREFKENKDPSPKVKRRRSVKISSVALEPTQWQSDSLQILTCTNDYRSMNDFLMKKVKMGRWAFFVLLQIHVNNQFSPTCPWCHVVDQRPGHRRQQERHHGGHRLQKGSERVSSEHLQLLFHSTDCRCFHSD